MRTSGVESDTPLTVAVLLIALAFLVVLAGGPSQFMLVIQQTLEPLVSAITRFYQGTHA